MPSRLANAGFSLVELMVALAIMAILGTVVTQAYMKHVERARIQNVIGDLRDIQVQIAIHKQTSGSLPLSLVQIGLGSFRDPWGNLYVYVPFNVAEPVSEEPSKKKGQSKAGPKDKARKDRNLHPINTDYDLYSMGKDGKTTLPLTAGISQDDIIRASDGAFIGLAADY
jgi:general secretion pathway protein G